MHSCIVSTTVKYSFSHSAASLQHFKTLICLVYLHILALNCILNKARTFGLHCSVISLDKIIFFPWSLSCICSSSTSALASNYQDYILYCMYCISACLYISAQAQVQRKHWFTKGSFGQKHHMSPVKSSTGALTKLNHTTTLNQQLFFGLCAACKGLHAVTILQRHIKLCS